MADAPKKTFIVDCHNCKAKVAAVEEGRAERSGWADEIDEPYGERYLVGHCPSCFSLLVGESIQVDFEGYDAYEDGWADVVRIYPKPAKSFSSIRVPVLVRESLAEAERALQVNANIAACVMLGRALEALCRDVLKEDSAGDSLETSTSGAKAKKISLGTGIRKMHEMKVIDGKLFDWSQQLQAFRNLAAHPDTINISREDAADLQTFAYAIVEYVYDLSDRYNEFKTRLEQRIKRKNKEKPKED